ncbi:MAG: rane protein [Oscillospiraceae bacterium]|nr:rane protein [Oscillospiraceae bacterium]
MTEPLLFGYPLTVLFLFFLFYSLAGWMMETIYCSILERRFVVRGFLYGPICPIYGVGVLLMVLFFKPFMDYPVLFYLVAVVVMSAWEYFVGWFLETTTHIKYWDYSHFPFNIKGRICLWVCLTWGILSYLMLYVVHPHVEHLANFLPEQFRWIASGVLGVLLITDAVTTIRKLALMSRLMNRLEQASGELQIQVALGKAELSEFLDSAKDNLADRLAAAAPDGVVETAEQIRAKYNELLRAAVRQSSRFRNRYRDMISVRHPYRLEDVKAAGNLLRERLQAANQARKEEKRLKKRDQQNNPK